MPTKLGQNFLKDKDVIQKIIKAADLRPDDFIVEIGPGEGILTEALSKAAGKILAIEIDINLAKLLKNKFSKKENVAIINEDILKINLAEKIQNLKFKIQNSSYKVVANIPYYITSPILRLFLESEFPPQEMLLMVQKEVAERIIAKPGKMSILALSVQYFAKAQLLFSVPAAAFSPTPKVDSAVLKITPYSNQKKQPEVKKFFRVVRAGFSAKRKTLANNLANSFHLDKKIIESSLNRIKLTSLTRAQELSLEDWKKLARII